MENEKQIAFMEAYKPVHDRFERFCRARVYGEMEHGDLMNESLLIAFQKFDGLKNENALLSYLIGIAIRVLSNANRKNRAKGSLSEVNELARQAEDRTETRLEVSILYEALAELPVEQRESLILFEISGFSIKEIAKLHKTRESTVKQRLRRGRNKLGKILNAEPKTSERKIQMNIQYERHTL